MITKAQIVNFINKQPTDRPVAMGQSSTNYPIGCVMIHYGKEILNIQDRFSCGYTRIGSTDHHVLEMDIALIVPENLWGDIKTYGDIQKSLGATHE